MPLTRYQIRNEFNLADPELYRAANKDDPEALLEGVAMAGFVGLLRQLGDLAEFAAEIFHDLHEEVMATAARGHGLMARIQQLEADVPLIERKLLSQTDQTTFYYNTGVDWHPQMCTEQNLITQGDMPRFIRDSYEECRGPPQLFLLDKFDIGGAGACLKRYTDPSSFKVDPTNSDATKLGVQRDRRTRKSKKKQSHLRNGGTPEVLTTSHAKLHRLLLEERIGNDSKYSMRHVKLKKRVLDGSKRTNSYMEKFLQTMSPEHSETDETEAGQPILRLTYDHSDASEREVLDIQPVIAADDSLYFTHAGQEVKLRPSVMYSYDFSKSRRNRGSTISIEDGNSIGTASPLRIPITEKELGVDDNNRNINGFSSPHYDATANETNNFMDALANMESEAETDNEYIPKKELRYFSKHPDVYDSREQILDSQSVDNSSISDDGITSLVTGTSTSSSHGVPSREVHGNREAESSISMKTYEAVIVDHLDAYDKTEKTTSSWCSNPNGESVGSLVTPYIYKVGDASVQKDSSQLLQSYDTGAGVYYGKGLSENIYDSGLPQPERNRVNGGAVTASDDPCMVDNVPVVVASIERQESNDPSETSAHRSINFSHDHSKLSSMIENETLQKGKVDEFLSETYADAVVVSPQLAVDTQLQEHELGYQEKDISSHLIPPANNNIDSYRDTVSNDDDVRSETGESLDGFNNVTDTAEKNVGHNASVLPEGHSYDDGSLYTTGRELAATKSISETHDSEGHISSGELLSQSVHEDDVVPETYSSSNHDCGQAISPMSIYLLSGISNSDEDVILHSDSITQKLEDLQTATEVTLEGAPPLPPLPPMQWMAGKPQDSFHDAEGELVEFSMASDADGSSLPSAFGLNSTFPFTALNGDSEQTLNATETDESLQSTSSHYPSVFPLPTDSTPHFEDATEENDLLSLPTSDKQGPNSSIHSRTHQESGRPDTFAIARETPVPSSRLCLPTSSTSTDAVTIEAMQSSVPAEFSVPSLRNMSADTKEIIQPRAAEHTLVSTAESLQSSTTWESPQSSLGDNFVNEFNTSEVPMLSTNPSPKESSSYSWTEHGTQGNEEEVIKHLEARVPLIKDEERRKQEIKSSERQASWSLALQNYEGEKLAEKPAFKLPRPRNPLIQSADALDRSKLKKVATLNRPKALVVDERGSILEQIRTKSFNLKPAPAPVLKPIIQAPSMNLKVAAILEKANKIRRATAGSDEDDEDDWSDD